MKKFDIVTLPSVDVRFSDPMGLIMLKEIYTRGLYPSFVEKMSILMSRNPYIMNMADQSKLTSHEHDSSQQELATIKQMLEQMQKTQNLLMDQVVDYRASFDIITNEMQSMREVTKMLQDSLTETMEAIKESGSSAEIFAKLNEKSVNIQEVVKQSETVIQTVDTKIAQAPIKPTISTDPIADVTLPSSSNSELEDLDMDMFDQGLGADEMNELMREFKGV